MITLTKSYRIGLRRACKKLSDRGSQEVVVLKDCTDAWESDSRTSRHRERERERSSRLIYANLQPRYEKEREEEKKSNKRARGRTEKEDKKSEVRRAFGN